MQSSRPGASTARSSSTHARSHSLSDPHSSLTNTRAISPVPPPHSASSTSAFEIYNASQFVPTFQYPGASTSENASHMSPNPSATILPHVALRAASPQSMVSSGSPSSAPSPSASAEATVSGSVRAGSAKKSSGDRNRKPCGACSSSKRKCTPVPDSPNLCVRCKNGGRKECPPHISWTDRKASMRDGESLSPLDMEDREFSSRSTSPSYYGAGRSPIGYNPSLHTPNQNEQSTTQEWVQAHIQGTPSNMGVCEPIYAPYAQPQLQNQNAGMPRLVQQGVQTNAGLNRPVLPVCHVCQTAYDEYSILNYAMAAYASMPSSSYEQDPDMLRAYGHVPPRDPHY